MARMKKRKLSWQPSRSSQVVGYKFYWSFGGEVDYASQSVKLGNITQVTLPDDVEAFVPTNGPVEFGITAVDELGNESDMVTLKAPYQFNVPKAPEDLYLQKLDDFSVISIENPDDEEDDRVDYYITNLEADDAEEKEPVMLLKVIGSANR